MQTKLERYAAKYGEAFMNELPDIIRTYCLANDLRVPTKKRPSNLHIIRVIAEATSEVLGIPIENIYSKSRLRPLVPTGAVSSRQPRTPDEASSASTLTP